MKNSTNVAGMALASPLRMKTAISRRNAGFCQGMAKARQPGPSVVMTRDGWGTGACHHKNQASTSATAKTLSQTDHPITDGNTDARITPIKAAPEQEHGDLLGALV